MSDDGDDRMGLKIKTPKIPRASDRTPQKSLDQKLIPKKFHAESTSLKNFPTELNAMRRNKHKNSGIGDFKSQNSFDYPRHLKSGFPPPLPNSLGTRYQLTNIIHLVMPVRILQ